MGTQHRLPNLRSSSSSRNSRFQDSLPFAANPQDLSSPHHVTSRSITRRGHSDGDLLVENLNSNKRQHNSSGRPDLPGLGHTSTPLNRRDEERGHHNVTAARRAMMVEDRRRRLSEHRNNHTYPTDSSFIQSAMPPPASGASYPSRERSVTVPVIDSASRPNPNLNERPLPPRPSLEAANSRAPKDLGVPRWQLDEEISQCPICGTTFTFWHRKHHCRKCGRVVCANCSPHRITIPAQYIVHPPEFTAATSVGRINNAPDVIDLTAGDESTPEPRQMPQAPSYHASGLGGGQEVRLCNPCVPDPNPSPHIPHDPYRSLPLSAQRTVSPPSREHGHERQAGHLPSNSPPGLTSRIPHNRLQRYRLTNNLADFNASLPPLPPFPSRRHAHSLGLHEHRSSTQSFGTMFGSAPGQSEWQHLEGFSQRQRPSIYQHRHHASLGTASEVSGGSFGHNLQPPNLRQSLPPRPPLREEDECPICHRALPPRGLDDSDMVREQHVITCIETHFSSSASGPSQSTPVSATNAAVIATSATPGQAAGRMVSYSHSTAAGSTAPLTMQQQRRRTTGMVIYNATEKDCVGSNGESEAECVICFEEFEVGDEMGRLECLCRFHAKCIRQWWGKKGPGACPVHQEGT